MTSKLAKKMAFGLSLILLLCIEANAADFNAEVNRTELELGETLQLVYSYNADAKRESPDFSALKTHFNILSVSPSSQFVEVIGSRSVSNTWTVILEPKSKGKLLIPPLSFGGDTAGAFEITVKEAGPIPAQLNDVMIDLRVDKDSVYIGEEFKVSYLFSYAVSIADYDFKPLQIENADVEALEHNQYQRKIGNRQFYVLEMPYLVRATGEDTIDIPELIWKVQVRVGGASRSIFDRGRYQELRLQSPAKTIRVKPVPAAFPAGATWRAAKSITIADNWSQNPKTLKIGEPVTRRIVIEGKGIQAAELPAIMQEFADDTIKVYPEQPQIKTESTNASSSSSRTESAAIILTGAGSITIPGVRIPWWNVSKDKLEYIEIEDTELAVLAAPASAARPPEQQPNALGNPSLGGQQPLPASSAPPPANSPWLSQWLWLLAISNVVTVLILVIVSLRLLKKTQSEVLPSIQSQKEQTQKQAWHELERAAKKQDHPLFLAKLRAWSLLYFGSQDLRHLIAEARHCDIDINTAINSLLARRYTIDTRNDIDLNEVFTLLKKLLNVRAPQSNRTNTLANLN